MNRLAIAFLTKDRVELTEQTVVPLLQPAKVDLWWMDGSSTRRGLDFPYLVQTGCLYGNPSFKHVRSNVRGGADAAIVYALTTLLDHQAPRYDFIGLCENDCLLSRGWYEPTMALFERGAADGLHVGAVSARCYEDRILFQRDGYAVTHNLGAGFVIFTREAARLILQHYRSTWSIDNRLTFCQLSNLDIGRWWAFRGNEQWLTADWGFDAILARAGLASLALIPSAVEMIGQVPSLAEQGLKLVTEPFVDELVCPDSASMAFKLYRDRLQDIWTGRKTITLAPVIHSPAAGGQLIFPHQIGMIGGQFGYLGADPIGKPSWELKWTQGFGPFSYCASEVGAQIVIPVSGPCDFLVSGGKTGVKVEITDDFSGYSCAPDIPPEGETTQVLALAVPAGVSYREVRLTVLTPGAVFYGLQTRFPQMLDHTFTFDHAVLPLPAAGGCERNPGQPAATAKTV